MRAFGIINMSDRSSSNVEPQRGTMTAPFPIRLLTFQEFVLLQESGTHEQRKFEDYASFPATIVLRRVAIRIFQPGGKLVATYKDYRSNTYFTVPSTF